MSSLITFVAAFRMHPSLRATDDPELEHYDAMNKFSTTELEWESAIELPDRELLGGLIDIDGPINIAVLSGLLNGSFNHWYISALSGNHVTITVSDNVSQNDLDVFCNQVFVVLSAQCNGTLVGAPNPPDP